MATITFRAKPETIYNLDNTVAYRLIKVPTIKRGHCDIAAFRSHPKFGAYANSDLFPALLKRTLTALGMPAFIRMDKPLPEGVAVDTTGFLYVVTITL